MNKLAYFGVLALFLLFAIALFKWNNADTKTQVIARKAVIESNNQPRNQQQQQAASSSPREERDQAPQVPPPTFEKDDSPSAPPVTVTAPDNQQQQSTSSSSSSPAAVAAAPEVANRFVERFFKTDPVAQSFMKRAWEYRVRSDKGDRINKNNEEHYISSSSTDSSNNNPHSKHTLQTSRVVSTPYHTGSKVPEAFSDFLKSFGEVNELADDFFGAQKMVDTVEASCGWDKEKANFKTNKQCIEKINFATETQRKRKFSDDPEVNKILSKIKDIEDDDQLIRVAPELIDIVVPSIRDLDFLEDWRDVIEGYHLIFVQDGDPNKFLKIPPWVDYELYNRNDIEATLKKNSWIISQKDASIRNFGFLVSRKPFIYTLDDDCFPVSATETNTFGKGIAFPEIEGGCSAKNARDLLHGTNPILQHIRNLLKPSSPYFFNTIYDGYRTGTDFVRGYPYSMRDGVTTVVSHGLWLNVPDYDAPTQLLKPTEKNTNHIDAAITVPAGVFYPMCSMNVAFDRKKIGPAFMQGLMGVGQPWARYDDMFAGWASKVVADHLAVGVKSGAPYIFHKKASNPFTNLKKEYKGLWWQEVVIAFCNRVQLPANATTPESAYRALALALRHELLPLHPYFDRLATAMLAWVDAWEGANNGLLTFAPSRKSDPEEVKKHESVAKKLRVAEPSSSSCITYDERYATCRHIHKQPVPMRREYFRRIAGRGRTSPNAKIKELVVVDLGDLSSSSSSSSSTSMSEDLWLNLCSIIVESSSPSVNNNNNNPPRDVILLVDKKSAASVPPEFHPLTHNALNKELVFRLVPRVAKNATCPPLFASIQTGLFFQQSQTQYDFAWIISKETRLAGKSWSNIFASSPENAEFDVLPLFDKKLDEKCPGLRISKKITDLLLSSTALQGETSSSSSFSTLDDVIIQNKDAVNVSPKGTVSNYQIKIKNDDGTSSSSSKKTYYSVWKSKDGLFKTEELEKEFDKDSIGFKSDEIKQQIEGGRCLVDFVSHPIVA